jgi:hypothetical protein
MDAVTAARLRLRLYEPSRIWQRTTPPLNLLGGYRFAAAPALDADLLRATLAAPATPFDVAVSPSGNRYALDPADPLELPAFLRRSETRVLLVAPLTARRR